MNELRQLKKEGLSQVQIFERLKLPLKHQNLANNNHTVKGPENYCFDKRGTR